MFALAAIFLGGCASDKPRGRMGSLPFPGLLTLYAKTDADSLGQHRYQRTPTASLLNGETDRGVLYTCRAGFLDIAHVRKVIDWTRYNALLIERALRDGRVKMKLSCNNRTTYFLRFDYPPEFASLSDSENNRLSRELSILMGAELAYLHTTWHEIITWYGFKGTGFIPETASAFSYDDGPSHAIGARVALRAMQSAADNSVDAFNEAVTRELRSELLALGATSQDTLDEAAEKVKSLWWSGNTPRKRFLDLGEDDGAVTPWIVEGVIACADAEAEPLRLPWLDDPLSDLASRILSVELDASIFEWSRIVRDIEGEPDRIRPDEHLPQIMAAIRTDIIERYGQDAISP